MFDKAEIVLHYNVGNQLERHSLKAPALTLPTETLSDDTAKKKAYLEEIVQILRSGDERRIEELKESQTLGYVSLGADAALLCDLAAYGEVEEEGVPVGDELVARLLDIHGGTSQGCLIRVDFPQLPRLDSTGARLLDIVGACANYNYFSLDGVVTPKELQAHAAEAIEWLKTFVMQPYFEEFCYDELWHIYLALSCFIKDLCHVHDFNSASPEYIGLIYRSIRLGVELNDDTLFPWHYRPNDE
jgi:hypothetical protein